VCIGVGYHQDIGQPATNDRSLGEVLLRPEAGAGHVDISPAQQQTAVSYNKKIRFQTVLRGPQRGEQFPGAADTRQL
jgi:hypothetical protein